MILRRQLDAARGGAPQPALPGPPQHGGPSAGPPPPSIGMGNNLFSGIMTGQGGQGGSWGSSAPANNATASDVYVTSVVTALTTYCPAATQLTHNGQTYTVTEATTLTIVSI